MSHRLLDEKEGWENAEFPIICETCLGPNPYVRMQKIPYGGACHISGRPYTAFRFKPGNDARYKKTVICQEVAKAKNVCQVCMLDLAYNLPVAVRDQALALQDDALPQSDAGREFALKLMEDNGELDNEAKFMKAPTNDLLLRLQRNDPYYKRNESRVCSFFVKGKCNRGAACPYKHEMPTVNPALANQTYKDRYYGTNDPVAKKMLARAAEMPKLTPPEDQTITTLFVGGVAAEVTEDDLRDLFYPCGEIESIRKVAAKNCAFVTYMARSAAERAAAELNGKLNVKGARLFLRWGRPAAQRPTEAPPGAGPSTSGAGVPGGMVPPQVAAAHMAGIAAQPNFFNLPGGYYPSMDPNALGSNPHRREGGPGGAGRGGGGPMAARGTPGFDPRMMGGMMPMMGGMMPMMGGMMPPQQQPQPKPPAGPPPAGAQTS